jgi:hypothetical protein
MLWKKSAIGGASVGSSVSGHREWYDDVCSSPNSGQFSIHLRCLISARLGHLRDEAADCREED